MLNASHVRTKRAAFSDAVDVEHAGQHLRLVADDADRMPVEAGEAAHEVRCPQRGWYSKNSPSSTTAVMTFFMS